MPQTKEQVIESLKEVEPNLYRIHRFMQTTSNLFGHGEAEIIVKIHCANYKDKRMQLEGRQGEKKIGESVLLDK